AARKAKFAKASRPKSSANRLPPGHSKASSSRVLFRLAGRRNRLLTPALSPFEEEREKTRRPRQARSRFARCEIILQRSNARGFQSMSLLTSAREPSGNA